MSARVTPEYFSHLNKSKRRNENISEIIIFTLIKVSLSFLTEIKIDILGSLGFVITNYAHCHLNYH